jgi:hypothetical protein
MTKRKIIKNILFFKKKKKKFQLFGQNIQRCKYPPNFKGIEARFLKKKENPILCSEYSILSEDEFLLEIFLYPLLCLLHKA